MTTGGALMGARTDTILGRAKQALGAITGNKKMKRKGQVQEEKGHLKGKFDSTVDNTQDALEDLKKTVSRT
jgi:uncharacterized protein YjbJ (UPF0337 family)